MYPPYIDHHWSKVVPPISTPHHPHTISPFRPPVTATIRPSPSGSRVPSSNHVPIVSPEAARGEDELGFTSLDRFATSFTPQWLKQLPDPLHTYHLPLPAPFPPNAYAMHIYPPPGMIIPPLNICPSILALPPHQGPCRPLNMNQAISDPIYYAVHYSRLLSLHLLSQAEEAEKAKVFSAPVNLHTVASNTFRLHIPGVREDVPRLGLGDRLLLRGLYPQITAPSQVAVEAAVVGLVKAQGFVYVRSPALAALDISLPKLQATSQYQISFAISAAPVLAMQDAVRAMAIALGSNLCAKNWLFPQPINPTSAIGEVVDWVDQALNTAQRVAVNAITRSPSSIPYLISGPPGTGKTKTLTELVLQILKLHSDAVVLVAAPSSSAADTLARRLASTLKPAEMFRLNAPERTFAEVPDDLLPYCVSANESFDLPPFEQLMRYRVVVCTLQDAAILKTARATNQDIMRAQDSLYRFFALPGQAKTHWTHLVIDEAAQASEPETLIALSVVLPIEPSTPPVLVLCGDPNQLGPIISSQEARQGELDVSLLERLFQRDVYRHQCATHLTQNYRSIAPILMVPSSMFYNDTLIPAATDVSLIPWKDLPNPDIPILFHGCETEESWVDEGASWYNPGEITAAVEIVQSLLADLPDLKQNQIAIMTPWREQVWQMRTRLRKLGLGGVDVGNIETYQGREFRVTILSCVRSKSRFLAEDKRTNMGLFNERRRFNVAITRAKELLVVIGNANLLKGDPYWNGFLQIAHRNSLYRGPEVDLEMTGAYISKIESAIRRARDDDDDGLFLAGEIARATLMDD